MWPIRDVTGDVIGFGARKLYEDDQGPKYLNTPETPLYKKATVLYGIDLAKSTIRTERTAVVVEGYTDVMACHLAGVTNAVATCGTAFGEDHVKVIRRLMGDTGSAQLKVGSTGAKVIFTFDGDEAGQNAALKSFALDQQFLAQTFVAVDPVGPGPVRAAPARGRRRGARAARRARAALRVRHQDHARGPRPQHAGGPRRRASGRPLPSSRASATAPSAPSTRAGLPAGSGWT